MWENKISFFLILNTWRSLQEWALIVIEKTIPVAHIYPFWIKHTILQKQTNPRQKGFWVTWESIWDNIIANSNSNAMQQFLILNPYKNCFIFKMFLLKSADKVYCYPCDTWLINTLLYFVQHQIGCPFHMTYLSVSTLFIFISPCTFVNASVHHVHLTIHITLTETRDYLCAWIKYEPHNFRQFEVHAKFDHYLFCHTNSSNYKRKYINPQYTKK